MHYVNTLVTLVEALFFCGVLHIRCILGYIYIYWLYRDNRLLMKWMLYVKFVVQSIECDEIYKCIVWNWMIILELLLLRYARLQIK